MQRGNHPRVPKDSPSAAGNKGTGFGQDRKALPSHTRSHNLTLLLRTLHSQGPLTRAELARATALTKVSISVLVAELLEQGLLIELGQDQDARVGKPGVKLDLARQALFLGSIDLSHGNKIRALAFDLDMVAVVELERDISGKSGAEALHTLVSVAKELCASAPAALLGIGVGAPGQVDREGTVLYSMRLDWEDVPLAQILQEACQCQVWVENDANVATLAEESVRGEPQDLFLISLWSGIGAGLVLDGRLIRGRSSAVGEIGHLYLPGGPPEETLEYWLSTNTLGERLSAAGPAGTHQVLDQAGEKLGLIMAPVVATLNISNVILSVPPWIDGEYLAVVVEKVFERQTSELTHDILTVTPSVFGANGVAVGAAEMVLRSFLGEVS